VGLCNIALSPRELGFVTLKDSQQLIVLDVAKPLVKHIPREKLQMGSPLPEAQTG
jgi:hypothetical protein